MSWYMQGHGTKSSASRQLMEATLHQPTPASQATFDKAKACLLGLISLFPDAPTEEGKPVTIIQASAGGHGAVLNSFQISYDMACLE